MNTLEILTVPVTFFQQNCRILVDRDSQDAVVVDPGGEARKITAELKNRNLKLKQIWLTHSHLDHCGGVKGLLDNHQGVSLVGHQIEKEFRQKVVEICQAYGIIGEDMQNCPEPDLFLSGGEEIKFNEHLFEVKYTPGHSPGHISFYYPAAGILLAGDTLFQGSIGRTDLPYGDHSILINSIKKQIYTLPEDTKVLSGHGPETTVGEEKRNNPFVRG